MDADFKDALAGGESVAAIKTQMDGVRPDETWSDQEEKLEAFRHEQGKNPLWSWKDMLELYKVFKLAHGREPRRVGESLSPLEWPLECFLAKWVSSQKGRSKVGAKSRCEFCAFRLLSAF